MFYVVLIFLKIFNTDYFNKYLIRKKLHLHKVICLKNVDKQHYVNNISFHFIYTKASYIKDKQKKECKCQISNEKVLAKQSEVFNLFGIMTRKVVKQLFWPNTASWLYLVK